MWNKMPIICMDFSPSDIETITAYFAFEHGANKIYAKEREYANVNIRITQITIFNRGASNCEYHFSGYIDYNPVVRVSACAIPYDDNPEYRWDDYIESYIMQTHTVNDNGFIYRMTKQEFDTFRINKFTK